MSAPNLPGAGGWRRRSLWCFLLLLLSFSARGADEEALRELWQKHLAAPDDHETALQACAAFTADHAGDPLLPIVRGLQAWHHIRAGHKSEALFLMAADATAPAGPVAEGARRLALGWLSRQDREEVAAALQRYYRQQVAYPKSLEQLPAAARGPVTDRFGKPWLYQLTGFARLPGFNDQKYSLRSPVLGETSEFKAAALLPYASRIVATPAQILPNQQGVKFAFPGGKAAVIGAGQAGGDLYLAWVGPQLIAVCDYTHWKIFPRP